MWSMMSCTSDASRRSRPRIPRACRVRPALDRPVVALDGGDEVQQLAAAQRVGDDVAVRAHPVGADGGAAAPAAAPSARRRARPMKPVNGRVAAEGLADRGCTPSAPTSTSPRTRVAVPKQRSPPSSCSTPTQRAPSAAAPVRGALSGLQQHAVEVAAVHHPVGRAVFRDRHGAEVVHLPGPAGLEQPHLLADGTAAIASIACSRPSAHSTREPLALICTPAPISFSSAACS